MAKRTREPEELHSEERFAPEFQELDIKMQSIMPKTVYPQASSYIGAKILIDDEGNLEGIRLTNGVYAKTLSDLHMFSSKNDCLLVFNGLDLDVLVKTLGEATSRNLYEGLSQGSEGLQYHYTPSRLLSIWGNGKTIRINSLKFWFRQFNLERARDLIGLDPNPPVPEEHKVLTLWNHMLEASRGVWPSTNPGVVYGPSLISKPTLDEGLYNIDTLAIPIEAQEMAYNCIHAPWVDVFVKGTIDQAWDYDLNSAYPFEMSRLPSLDYTGGVWTNSTKYVKTATYGFCLAIVEIFDHVDISPIRLRYRYRLYSPTGTWVGYVTKEEIDFIHRYKLGKVQVLNGWWFTVKRLFRPFRKASLSYIAQRLKAKDELNLPLSYVLKMSAASVYGRFLQKKQSLEGKWTTAGSFSPIYACLVMTSVKLKIARLLMDTSSNAYSVTVDGILVKDPISDRNLDRVPGGVKLAGHGQTTIAAPLIYSMEDRVSSIDLIGILNEDKYAVKLSLPSSRRVSLCEGLSRNSFDRIGQLSEEPYHLMIGAEGGRSWDRRPIIAEQLLEDMYTSKSIPVERIVWKDWQ